MRNTIDHRKVNILKKKHLRYFLEWLGMQAGTDEFLWYGDTTHKRDIRVDGRVHITGPISASNTVTISNEATSFWVRGGANKNELVVQRDATIKHNLYVEDDLIVRDDATIDQNLIVEGHAWIGDDSWFMKDLVVGKDATVRERLYVGEEVIVEHGDIHAFQGAIIGRDATVTQYLRVGEKAFIEGDTHMMRDVLIGRDATARENLYVGENLWVEKGDIRANQGAIFTRDATITEHLTVDDERGSVGHPGRGVTCDITACGVIYHVVKGIITDFKQKAWA